MSGQLDGKVIWVTGAGRGLGRAYAEGLAAEGAVVAVSDIAGTDEAVAAIRAAGGKAAGFVCDVTDEAAVLRCAADIKAQLGPIDGLVNNAGIYPFGPIEQTDAAFLERIFRINVFGSFHCIRAVVPDMKARRGGKIVNITSATFHTPPPMLSAYVATKGAVIGMTRSLARELGEFNINVNVIAPGLTETPGVAEAPIAGDMWTGILAAQCFKRREQPADLVGTVVFLCSPASDFITAQTINCDGGMGVH
ncbi:MAG: SDR family NAD(P)-dependent oxidoreductase [Immundisolibacter sp.]|uniref:SDR family NAD(P)-dependent oxidoreductase n=1 Tax=Immundisolibacter sp. TaxID=1934948 RepID=UPI003D0B8AC8